MNRLVKTKAKRKYSLGKRILAGVLSIAMIGSVSYVGNYVSKKSAKADPDTEVASSAAEYDITRYVYNLFEHVEDGSYYLNKDAKSSYTIYVPAKAEIVERLGLVMGTMMRKYMCIRMIVGITILIKAIRLRQRSLRM